MKVQKLNESTEHPYMFQYNCNNSTFGYDFQRYAQELGARRMYDHTQKGGGMHFYTVPSEEVYNKLKEVAKDKYTVDMHPMRPYDKERYANAKVQEAMTIAYSEDTIKRMIVQLKKEIEDYKQLIIDEPEDKAYWEEEIKKCEDEIADLESYKPLDEGIDGWDNRTGVIHRIDKYLHDNPDAEPPVGYINRRSPEYEQEASRYGDYVTTPFGNIDTDELMKYAKENNLLSESRSLGEEDFIEVDDPSVVDKLDYAGAVEVRGNKVYGDATTLKQLQNDIDNLDDYTDDMDRSRQELTDLKLRNYDSRLNESASKYFYVTIYEQSSVSGPEEGGYTSYGWEAVKSKSFKDEESARQYHSAYIANAVEVIDDNGRGCVHIRDEWGDEVLVCLESAHKRGSHNSPALTWAQSELGHEPPQRAYFDKDGSRVLGNPREEAQKKREKAALNKEFLNAVDAADSREELISVITDQKYSALLSDNMGAVVSKLKSFTGAAPV